jgi:FkbM family methyltransferase
MKYIIRFILGKNYKYFNSKYWTIVSFVYPLFIPKKGTLLYAGMNIGDSFQKIFFKYEKVIGFEPNIKNYEKVKHYNNINGVQILNLALSTKEGMEDFHLPDNLNNDASASLSEFSDSYGIKAKNVIKGKKNNSQKRRHDIYPTT